MYNPFIIILILWSKVEQEYFYILVLNNLRIVATAPLFMHTFIKKYVLCF